MAEKTRLIYDIKDKINSNNQEGLLLLIDFEKAFVSVEWNFLDEALKFFFNFGESMRRWVKTFYKNISSSIPYSGHCSTFSFSVSRDHHVTISFHYLCRTSRRCNKTKR